ncbi:ABC transporter ATP-binding protein [Gorillibacterium sp. sgz5001074]|uniref:ABC transporter ATP-binding protein n=1 Tax=Gorillibacterium sp. sgz5001074 TaxID=3446695 RepID=UPI003F67CB1F
MPGNQPTQRQSPPSGPQPMVPGMGGGPGRGFMGPKVRPKNMKDTLARLWRYLRRQRGGLAAVILLTAVGAGLGLIGPYLIGVAIDDYIIPRDRGGLVRLCLILAAVYAVGGVLNWFQAYIMTKVSQRTVRELRDDLFGRLQRLPLKFFDGKTHGELMSRTTNDMDNISNTLNQSVAQLINSALTLAGTLIIMLTLNVWLTLINIVIVPLTMLVTRKIAGYTRKAFAGQQKSLGELNGFIEETVSGQKVVAAYCREEKAISEFDTINRRLTKIGIQAQISTGLMGPVMNVLGNLSFALIAFAGGWMALDGLMTVGVVVSFLNYSRQFARPINELANQFNMIQSGIAGAERVFEIMDTEPEYAEAGDGGGTDTEAAAGTDAGRRGRKLEEVRGEVVFRDVDFCYKEGVPVLREVSLHAKPGDTIALVGPTGAGKTTVINLLTRFYEIGGGSVTIDGTDIRDLDKDSLRSRLGIVLQDAYVFSDTIRENIRYGKPEATDAEVEAAAKLANADSFIRKLPKGYATVLSGEGHNLSHGQRQLLTIARAILADLAILILDEATSSIDTRTEMHIQEAMRELMKGRTSFVIAHRLGTIREADQILVIDGGRIIERGTHHELLERKGFYYELNASQFQRVG